jgi:hypothetical protein
MGYLGFIGGLNIIFGFFGVVGNLFPFNWESIKVGLFLIGLGLFCLWVGKE